MELFRDDLSEDETEDFKKWARENYTPFSEIKGVWHPIVQQQCIDINKNSKVEVYDDQMRLNIMKQRTGQMDSENN